MSLFKSPKVEEVVKQAGNIRPLAINPDFRRALKASFESSMATWRLGWHMTVLINYLYNHCQDDPVLKAVCNHLHGAIRESRQTSAQVASVAIATQRRMILDASVFRDCRPSGPLSCLPPLEPPRSLVDNFSPQSRRLPVVRRN